VKEKNMPDSIAEIAQRHGFSPDAAGGVAEALRRGGGRMAQFSHPELGGSGQWAGGGMIMIGDMFNSGLKDRVAALCRDLAAVPGPVPAAAEDQPGQTTDWWPGNLGAPSATGAQNDIRYACFPDTSRLVVMRDGRVRIYDTGDHRPGGFSQEQGGSQSLAFTSQTGPVRLEGLTEI
jgi:hypothetical protein